MIEFDDDKNTKNIDKHGIPLTLATKFDFTTALIMTDERFDYGETRFVALGFIADRLHVLVYTERVPNVRIISLRKANKREISQYETIQSP